jgi:hypothetical protein
VISPFVQPLFLSKFCLLNPGQGYLVSKSQRRNRRIRSALTKANGLMLAVSTGPEKKEKNAQVERNVQLFSFVIFVWNKFQGVTFKTPNIQKHI